MTISNTDRVIAHIGDGIVTEWEYGFLIPDAASAFVTLRDQTTGGETPVSSSDYTISGLGNSEGGQVIYPTVASGADPIDSNTLIVIYRQVPNVQDVSVDNVNSYDAGVVEGVWDYLTMMIQDMANTIARNLTFPIGETTATIIPNVVARANKLLGFDGSGGITTSSITIAQMETVYDNYEQIALDAAAAASSAADALASAGDAEDSAIVAAAAEKGISWYFDADTSIADPGDGRVRFNNASLASVTAIAIDKQDINDIDVSDYTSTWGNSTNTYKGTITVRKVGDVSFFALYKITATVVDNTDWLQLTVTYVTGIGTLSEDDVTYLHFTRAGDQGAAGAGSGDMLAANNLSDVASPATSRSNLGLGALATKATVAEADLNANIVGIDKLKHHDQVGITAFNSTGTPAILEPSSSGQALIFNGTNLAFGAISSAWELISTTAVTAVSTLDFSWEEDDYTHIKIVAEGLKCSSNLRHLYLRLKYSGQTLYTGRLGQKNEDLLGVSIPSGYNFFKLAWSIGNGGAEGVTGEINISGHNSQTSQCGIQSFFTGRYYKSNYNGFKTWGAPEYGAVEKWDGARLYWSAGNFQALGDVYVYGLKRT